MKILNDELQTFIRGKCVTPRAFYIDSSLYLSAAEAMNLRGSSFIATEEFKGEFLICIDVGGIGGLDFYFELMDARLANSGKGVDHAVNLTGDKPLGPFRIQIGKDKP